MKKVTAAYLSRQHSKLSLISRLFCCQRKSQQSGTTLMLQGAAERLNTPILTTTILQFKVAKNHSGRQKFTLHGDKTTEILANKTACDLLRPPSLSQKISTWTCPKGLGLLQDT